MSPDDTAREALQMAHAASSCCRVGGWGERKPYNNLNDQEAHAAINALARAARLSGAHAAAQAIALALGRSVALDVSIPEPDWLPQEEKHGD